MFLRSIPEISITINVLKPAFLPQITRKAMSRKKDMSLLYYVVMNLGRIQVVDFNVFVVEWYIQRTQSYNNSSPGRFPIRGDESTLDCKGPTILKKKKGKLDFY